MEKKDKSADIQNALTYLRIFPRVSHPISCWVRSLIYVSKSDLAAAILNTNLPFWIIIEMLAETVTELGNIKSLYLS